MAESAIQKLARLFQSIRDLETELGTGTLSKSEKTLFTSIADISKNKKEGITIEVHGLDKVKQKSQNTEMIIKKMDEWTMIGSAMVFLIFNICYWMTAKLK